MPLKEDFLENDNAIPGQNFVCLSFISPENVLKNKDVFLMNGFFRTLHKNSFIDVNTNEARPEEESSRLWKDVCALSFEQLEEKYKDFLYQNQEVLEREFYEKNDFRTSVRGLKVRGVYDTRKEAEARAKVLQSRDPNFDVFVAQVGFWLPWDPHPHRVEDQEYAEQQLNELVHKYQENRKATQQHYEEHKEYVKREAERKAKEHHERIQQEKQNASGASADASTADASSADASADTSTASATTEQRVNEPVNMVDQEVKDSLQAEDPWMARKREQAQQQQQQS
jgi:hypothetical protein